MDGRDRRSRRSAAARAALDPVPPYVVEDAKGAFARRTEPSKLLALTTDSHADRSDHGAPRRLRFEHHSLSVDVQVMASGTARVLRAWSEPFARLAIEATNAIESALRPESPDDRWHLFTARAGDVVEGAEAHDVAGELRTEWFEV